MRMTANSAAHRIYILPTSIGFYFSFIALILFLIAISYGHNLAFYCTFLFFSFVSFSAVISNEAIKNISLASTDTKIIVRDSQYSPVKVIVKNNGKKSQYDISVEVLGITVCFIDELRPMEDKTVFFDANDLDLGRGIYQLSRLTFSSRFPLGLFYSWRYQPCDITLKVTPKKKNGYLAQALQFQYQEDGRGRRNIKLGADEYIETRNHLSGEGLRRIDKKKSLRLGRPQVRVFEDEKTYSHCFDLRGDMIEDNLSKAYSHLSEIDSNEVFSLLLPNGVLTKNDSGINHKLYLYELLSEYEKQKVLIN